MLRTVMHGWLGSNHLLKACGKRCEGLTISLYGRPRHLRTSCMRPSPRAFRTADEDTCTSPRFQGLSRSLAQQKWMPAAGWRASAC